MAEGPPLNGRAGACQGGPAARRSSLPSNHLHAATRRPKSWMSGFPQARVANHFLAITVMLQRDASSPESALIELTMPDCESGTNCGLRRELDPCVDFAQGNRAVDRVKPQRVIHVAKLGEEPLISLASESLHKHLILRDENIVP